MRINIRKFQKMDLGLDKRIYIEKIIGILKLVMN